MDVQWPWVVWHEAPRPEHHAMYLSPGSGRSLGSPACGAPTSYRYSLGFIAGPETWRPGSVADDSLRLPTFSHEVVFPSLKALAWDDELAYLRREPRREGPDLAEATPLRLAEGSARTFVPARATGPVANPFLPADALGPARLHHTLDGVRGRGLR